MALRIIKPGRYASIQDMGRWGHQQEGVPVSGAMDRYALQVANLLCGNAPDLPALEMAWHGLQAVTETDLVLSYCGGGAVLELSGRQLPPWRPLYIPAFSVLSFLASESGMYTCLAIGGGFEARMDLGSASTFPASGLGGIEGRAVRAGDLLLQMPGVSERTRNLLDQMRGQAGGFFYPAWSFDPARDREQGEPFRLIRGPEFDWFDRHAQDALLNNSVRISPRSNRMATRLDGIGLHRVIPRELRSTAVCRGTMQVMHDGTPLVLMADAQTIGGYPRIAQLAAVDLDRFAQRRPGTSIRFQWISPGEAEALYLARETKTRQVFQAIGWKLDALPGGQL
jgi:antagonist of KipI